MGISSVNSGIFNNVSIVSATISKCVYLLSCSIYRGQFIHLSILPPHINNFLLLPETFQTARNIDYEDRVVQGLSEFIITLTS